jgi:hypothetical protein
MERIHWACAAAIAVFAIAGRARADTPPGWDSLPEVQPFCVMLRVIGSLTLLFLVLLFIGLRVARVIRKRKSQSRSLD